MLEQERRRENEEPFGEELLRGEESWGSMIIWWRNSTWICLTSREVAAKRSLSCSSRMGSCLFGCMMKWSIQFQTLNKNEEYKEHAGIL